MFDDFDLFTAVVVIAVVLVAIATVWLGISMLMSFHAEANALLQSAGSTH